MILPFSTQLNGKPTYFVEKIWQGLKENDLLFPGVSLEAIDRRYFECFGKTLFDYSKKVKPKTTTIREDKTNRWKPGTKIDFFINCRQPTMFRFAPVLPVVSVQKIEIAYNLKGLPIVTIDGKYFYVPGISLETKYKMLHLAQNDGFDTIEGFFAYFNEDFTGKIIHWTHKRY